MSPQFIAVTPKLGARSWKKNSTNTNAHYQPNLLDEIVNIEVRQKLISDRSGKDKKASLIKLISDTQEETTAKPLIKMVENASEAQIESLLETFSDLRKRYKKPSLIESQKPGIDRFLAKGKKKEKMPIACVNEYKPGGRNKSYFRLS